jgi:isopenicillin-N N-acyltransferase-like protein
VAGREPISRHASRELDPRARGVAFGVAQRPAVEVCVGAYERLLAEAAGLDAEALRAKGVLVAERLSRTHPDLGAEIEGIAAGAGVPTEMLAAVNARTELLAGSGLAECSVLGLAPPRANAVFLAQNWDWHPELAGARVIWTIHDGLGGWFATLTEAGMLAKIGLNDRGLGVCLNILSGSLDGGVDCTPIHVLLRRVIAECGDVDEVGELLAGERIGASSCLTVASGSGAEARLCAFEVSPAGVFRIEPTNGACLHTNHFLRTPPGTRDLLRSEWPSTVDRLEELRASIARMDGPVGPPEAVALLRSHDGASSSLCCHEAEERPYKERLETLASVYIDPASGTMAVSEGPPCSSAHITV